MISRRKRDSADVQRDFGFKTPRRRRKPPLGRPPIPGSGVPHLPREVHPRYPLHVTLKVLPQVWQLRSHRCYAVIGGAFYKALARQDARVTHFSIQANHVHLVFEAEGAPALARTVQGMAIRIAKGLNRLMRRHGRVFADRYHSRPLRTPTEVRRALVYVLCNHRKHLGRRAQRYDEYSSAAWFTGWSVRVRAARDAEPLVKPAMTWLLRAGWLERGGGAIRPDESPSAE